MKLRTLGPTLLCAAALWAPAALAQNAEQPQNMNHFYMARQQVHIIDESPMVTRSTMPAGAAGSQGAGGMPVGNRPVPLPRAGFTPYFTPSSSMGSNLPATGNGVPTRAPASTAPNGLRAKAGGMKAKTATAPKPAAPSGPPVAKMYNPTGGYGGGSAAGTSSGGSSSISSSSSRQVRGSVMSWKKNRGF